MESVDTIQPKVSVVITCYNHGNFLAEAIRSVQRQTYQPIEIIVVDDGSTDNTREVAKGFPEVNYIFQKNAGLSAARNTGVTASLGKYIVFLVADDRLLKRCQASTHNPWTCCHHESGTLQAYVYDDKPGIFWRS